MSSEEKSSQTGGKNNTDQPDELHKELFTNGKPSSDGQYINGKRHGKWKFFYQNGVLKAIRAHPEYAAIVSFLLALPFMTLFLLLMLGIEPNLDPFDHTFKSINGHLGSFIVLGLLFLTLAGGLISAIPVVQGIKTGNGMIAFPLNLLLSIVILLFIVAFIGAIVVDQYPCWIGVPNCD